MTTDPIRLLTDRVAIRDLLTRYATAVDRRDWDLYRSVFTTDAEIDYTSAGGIAGTVDEVVAFLDEVLSGFEMTQHLVSNLAHGRLVPPRPGTHHRRLAQPQAPGRIRLVRPRTVLRTDALRSERGCAPSR